MVSFYNTLKKAANGVTNFKTIILIFPVICERFKIFSFFSLLTNLSYSKRNNITCMCVGNITFCIKFILHVLV